MPRKRNRADQALTDLVSAFPDQDDAIIEDFFPGVPTDVLTGFWYSFSKSRDLELLESADLGDDEKIPEVEVELDADKTFRCRVFARRAPVGRIGGNDAAKQLNWSERSALAAAASLRLEMRNFAINQVLRALGSLPGVTLSVARRFDNRASSDSQPIVDLQLYVNQASRQCGRRINRIGMCQELFTAIQQHDDAIDRAQHLPGKILTKEALEDILGVPRGTLRLYDAQYRSSAKGVTPKQYRKHLGSDVVLAYIEPGSLKHAGMGLGFGFGGFTPDKISIVQSFDPNRGALGSDVHTAVCIFDPNIANADAGFVIRGGVNTADAVYGGYLD